MFLADRSTLAATSLSTLVSRSSAMRSSERAAHDATSAREDSSSKLAALALAFAMSPNQRAVCICKCAA